MYKKEAIFDIIILTLKKFKHEKKRINLTFKKLSITALNRDTMVNIIGGVTGSENNCDSIGCNLLGGTKNSKNVDDMLCKSKAVALGDPCFN